MAGARAPELGLENTADLSEKENQEDFCASMSDEASSSLRDSQGRLTAPQPPAIIYY